MKVLTLRQPWAWMVVHGGKNVENRTWNTKFRGEFLIHAAKGMTRAEYRDALDFAFGVYADYRTFYIPSSEVPCSQCILYEWSQGAARNEERPTMPADVNFTTRCRAFSGRGVNAYRVSVDGSGTVSVYDSVAGHYTTCHALSASAERRIVRQAGVEGPVDCG